MPGSKRSDHSTSPLTGDLIKARTSPLVPEAVERLPALVNSVAMVLIVAVVKGRPSPIGQAMLGWGLSGRLADFNQCAMIQLTNRTAHAQVVGLGVQALNWRGYRDPVPC